jgi:tetratricopeptide (TPR) repeat protein
MQLRERCVRYPATGPLAHLDQLARHADAAIDGARRRNRHARAAAPGAAFVRHGPGHMDGDGIDMSGTIERTADFSLLKTAGIPALEVLQLARTVVEGRLAQAQGDSNKAVERFEQAAALQDALPYTEPPYWYYPVRQSLAAALMQAGRLAEAEEQFRRALARAPNNGWSYYGLLELSRARGDAAGAQTAEAELAKTWVGDRQQLQISKL